MLRDLLCVWQCNSAQVLFGYYLFEVLGANEHIKCTGLQAVDHWIYSVLPISSPVPVASDLLLQVHCRDYRSVITTRKTDEEQNLRTGKQRTSVITSTKSHSPPKQEKYTRSL